MRTSSRVTIAAALAAVGLSATVGLAQQVRWDYRRNGSIGDLSEGFFACVAADNGTSFFGGETRDSLSSHFFVVGLDSSGHQRWIDDSLLGRVNVMALSGTGLVCAAGLLDSSGTSKFLVVAYDTGGNRRWVRTIGSGQGEVASVCVDATGTVYACGFTDWPDVWSSFTIAAFDTAGTRLWLDTLGAPGLTPDRGVDIALGSDGFLYACGSLSVDTAYPFGAAVKVSRSGQVRWRRSLGMDPLCICCDSAAGVYVGGGVQDSTGDNVCAAGLDSAGNRRWLYYYDAGGRGSLDIDCFRDAAYGNGRLFFGGQACRDDHFLDACIFGIDTSGAERWQYYYRGDRNYGNWVNHIGWTRQGGFVHAAGLACSLLSEICEWCLDSDGNQVWVYRYWGTGNGSNSAQCLALDTLGRTYFGGSAMYATRDCWAACLKQVPIPRGLVLGGTGDDWGQALVPSGDGGYMAAGWTNSFGAVGRDFWLVKISPAAETVWTRRYGTPGEEYGYALTRCADGGYCIAGFSDSIGPGRFNLMLVRTDAAGNELWRRGYGTAGMILAGYAIAELPEGGFLVAGDRALTGQPGTTDMFLFRLEPDGDSLWLHTYGSDVMDDCVALELCSDSGAVLGGLINSDLALLRVNATGDSVWCRRYGYPSYAECANALKRTGDGGFVIAGKCAPTGSYTDAWLLRTDSLGDTLWTRRYGGSQYEVANGMVTVPGTGYALAGYTTSFGAGASDVYLVGADTVGNQLSATTYGGTLGDQANAIIAATGGGYAMLGATSSFGAGGNDLYFVLVGGPTGIHEPRLPADLGVAVKPRPVGATIIRGVLFLPRDMTELSRSSDRVPRPLLLDVAGRKVMELRAGANDVSRMSSGVYFVHHVSDVGRETPNVMRVVIQR